ncbi:TonB-dependent receptor plug domain-containing protein [Aureibaculum conchae]|uniref:TonB-dependent receptor plug domain-containing protein n=1 Tax=Aureibaculum sp. 2308TA14-22 TaxID=3108392 RepID=UPI00339AF7A6
MRKIFSLTVVFIALTMTLSVKAQNVNKKIIISGFVKDSLNIPMKGIFIFIDNTNSKKKAKTNSNGFFKIRTKKSPEKIIAKSPYFGTEAITYQNNNSVVIIFKKVNLNSNENIEKFITKASSKRKKKKDKIKKYYLNMLDYLANQPGIYIQDRNNGTGIIRINGHGNSTSLFIEAEFGVPSSPEPLFVIDGINANKSQVLSLNPIQVESVTVLKHADAGLYGLRGGNGVIKIKTKRGD